MLPLPNHVEVLRSAPFQAVPPVAFLEPATAVESALAWPLTSMQRECFRRGELLFKAGDRADKLFYITRGLVRLPELNVVLKSGETIGEIGVLSPSHCRTASAICEEDIEAYTLDQSQILSLFRKDPVLALELVQLTLKRFIHNHKAESEAVERTKNELRIARDIQTSMLPHVFPAAPAFETSALMEPAKEVGGDFYDCFMVEGGKLYLLVGDACGKGISAALFMAISKALLKSEGSRGIAPEEVLSRVNNLLCPENQRCMFATVCCVTFTPQTGEVRCASAGHPFPVLGTAEGEVKFVQSHTGTALGVVENSQYVAQRFFLKPGDLLLLYSDGVTEATSAKRELFSEHRLLESVRRRHSFALDELISGIRADIAAHELFEQRSDDITLLALRYKGVPSGGHARRRASVPRTSRRRVRTCEKPAHE